LEREKRRIERTGSTSYTENKMKQDLRGNERESESTVSDSGKWTHKKIQYEQFVGDVWM
jgi:hypothetical protein